MCAAIIVDPVYNSLYAKVHEDQDQYGASGIGLLPEVVLYMLDAMAAGRLSRQKPWKVLDFGCGRCRVLEGLQRVLHPIWNATSIPEDLSGMLELIQDRLNTVMEARNPAALDMTEGGESIMLLRYDPAIKEFATLPTGPFDFVICTDVLEHIPDVPTVDGESVLDRVIGTLAILSENHYMNISVRSADQLLPDGQNAHCTLKSPQDWHVKLQQHLPAIEVYSRAKEACSFITHPPSPVATKISRDFAVRYGVV